MGTRGIVSWTIVNRDTLRPKATLVGYKMNAKDKGVVFNNCPWCGTDITDRIRRAEAK
jgi:predicted RNA-binding Zn-ribbon protein involved in translation (DUF1610 family)